MRAKQANPIQPAHGHRAIAAAALLAAASLGLLTPHAHAEKRPYRLQRTDCVITSDSSCVGPNAKATMVLQQQKQTTTGDPTDKAPGGLPTGYAERVLTVSPGAISAETFSTLRDVAGWPAFTCTRELGLPGTCTDGRGFDAVVTNSCNGMFQNKVYTWTEYGMTIPYGDDTPVRVLSAAGHSTCAPANSEFAFLVRDSTAATTTNRDLSAAEINAYAARTVTDAVSADDSSVMQLCKEYGASGVASATVRGFNSCRNNTLSVYTGGSWTRRNACTAGNQWLNSITCSFPAP